MGRLTGLAQPWGPASCAGWPPAGRARPEAGHVARPKSGTCLSDLAGKCPQPDPRLLLARYSAKAGRLRVRIDRAPLLDWRLDGARGPAAGIHVLDTRSGPHSDRVRVAVQHLYWALSLYEALGIHATRAEIVHHAAKGASTVHPMYGSADRTRRKFTRGCPRHSVRSEMAEVWASCRRSHCSAGGDHTESVAHKWPIANRIQSRVQVRSNGSANANARAQHVAR